MQSKFELFLFRIVILALAVTLASSFSTVYREHSKLPIYSHIVYSHEEHLVTFNDHDAPEDNAGEHNHEHQHSPNEPSHSHSHQHGTETTQDSKTLFGRSIKIRSPNFALLSFSLLNETPSRQNPINGIFRPPIS